MTSAVAPAQIAVLLSWVCSLYTLILPLDNNFKNTVAWSKLIPAFGVLLDYLLDPTIAMKSSLRKSAIVQARRAIRSVSPIHELYSYELF
jgi:hypothetical protein